MGRRRGAHRLHALPPRAQAVALRRPARLPRGRRRPVVVSTLALVGLHRARPPGHGRARGRARSPSRRRPASSRCSSCSRSSLVGGVRFVARIVYERPLRGFRARAGRAPRADRRRRRRRPARAARDPAQPAARPRPGRLRRRRPAQARHPRRRRARCSGAPTQLRRILDEAEPDEITIAIPSAPGTLRARVVRAGAPARHPGPHAADGLRAAAGRLGHRRAPGARRAGRGHPRARAGAHGARPRRRAT